MTVQNVPSLGPQVAAGSDGEKLRALRRIKTVAVLALCLCIVVLVASRSFQDQLPWLSYVAAFAEAAVIGGIADWYAVVALFRRPLGLPIPHTAIIPENQARIADNLGGFIEANFLAPGPVREKLRQVDFAALVAEWLSNPVRSEGLSRFVARLAPKTLSAIEHSGVRDFATQRMLGEIEKIRVAPLAADLLAAFTDDRRHQQLFDEFVRVMGRFLSDEQALAAIRERIREELPSLFNLFRADAYLLKRIVTSAGSLLEEVRADPDHPLRREFDDFVHDFIARLRTSPDYEQRAERLKRDLMARPEVAGFAGDIWHSFRTFIEHDLVSDESVVLRHLTSMFVDVGKHLAEDDQIRADMNDGFVVALGSFVEAQKSGVSSFIADQVKRWDLAQLTRLVELNIGRDLQYIRFNGMLIGGIAGLTLHLLEQFLF